MKNSYTLYYLHRLNTVVNLGMLGKISSYPTYPIAVILKMAMHLEDPERTAFSSPLMFAPTHETKTASRFARSVSIGRVPPNR